MAYVTVPKDLAQVKPKFMFNLTKRQLICFGGGALLGLPVFFLTKGAIGTTPATLLMLILMLPCFMFGVYEKNGQPLEKLLGYYIQSRFIRPKQRPYMTDNFYAAIQRQIDINREVRQRLTNKEARFIAPNEYPRRSPP